MAVTDFAKEMAVAVFTIKRERLTVWGEKIRRFAGRLTPYNRAPMLVCGDVPQPEIQTLPGSVLFSPYSCSLGMSLTAPWEVLALNSWTFSVNLYKFILLNKSSSASKLCSPIKHLFFNIEKTSRTCGHFSSSPFGIASSSRNFICDSSSCVMWLASWFRKLFIGDITRSYII